MTLLFDLDGTLLDSTDLLLAGYKHTTRTMLDRETTDEEWLPHFGKTLRSQMALFNEDLADEMVSTYRRFYAENHDYLLKLYAGVPEMLVELHENGHKLGVVTSKLTHFAVRGLQLFGLTAFFDVIIGEDLVTAHKPDPASVLLAMARLGVRPDETWMIGDSPYDIQAGKAAGCRTAGVLWGPFDRKTLAPDAPDLFIEHPQDLPLLVSAPPAP